MAIAAHAVYERVKRYDYIQVHASGRSDFSFEDKE